MGNTNASRRIFEQLDRDQKGKITLHELVQNSNKDVSVPTLCSLTTLYHFDHDREGCLNFKEFVELEKFVQKIQKKCVKQKRRRYHEQDEQHSVKNFMTALLRKLNNIDEDIRHDSSHKSHQSSNHSFDTSSLGANSSAPCTPPTRRTISLSTSGMIKSTSANSLPDQKKKKPGLTLEVDGQKQSHSSANSSNTSTPITMHTSYRHSEFDNSYDSSEESNGGSPPRRSLDKDNDETIHDIKEQIEVELLPSLNKEAYSKQGRKAFLDWLFKLTDENKDNEISRNELECILTAVEKDQIDLTSLLYDFEGDAPLTHDSLVSCVMKEYDTRHFGSLSRLDFLKLSDLILSKYEARHMENGWTIKDWKMTHVLGEGGYGVVRYATRLRENPNMPSQAAIKIIKRGNVSDMSKLDVEIQAMQMLKFSRVVQLYEILEDDEYIYLVMELCGGGSLYEHLKDVPFEEDLARYYFLQLIDGLAYCHKNGVCHRDLRLENLLLDNNGSIKITDFGQARIFKKGWDLFSTQLVGSLYHLSPEQIENKVYSGEKVDIWNAGIILYCYLTCRLPFCSSDVMQMFEDIKKCNYEYPTDDPRIIVTEPAKELIGMMLSIDPQQRPTLEQIRSHPWTCGPQREPQLSLHRIKVDGYFKKAEIDSVREYVEHTLQKLLVHFKVCEREFRDADSAFLTIKCIQPKRNVKFVIQVQIEDDSLVLLFKLGSGETKEYRALIDKMSTLLKNTKAHKTR
ncbi:SNF1-related protein kinase catalytic subunit alpha KIN10 [Acrasis kona]|uniref:SNF1-related protein kinase catalytic subunit alpha KIN10 n=1 Tax=Acrasis kona TaxID=1008807 RepID=A0AAW2YPY0_9EUKA